MTPTQRTLALLRQRGWQVKRVEHWNAYARRRIDLWGADLIACSVVLQRPTLVQCTTGANHAARREKILAMPEALTWLRSGGRILIVSWSKRGGRGARKLSAAREEWITPEMFTSSAAAVPDDGGTGAAAGGGRSVVSQVAGRPRTNSYGDDVEY